MVGTANQTAGTANMDFGESLTFQIRIDLPAIDEADASDLIVEVFALDPANGELSNNQHHLCNLRKYLSI